MPISGPRKVLLEGDSTLPVAQALSSKTRLLMLSLLSHNPMNVSDLAQAMEMPISTISTNLKILEEAGLLTVQYVPGTRGHQKLVAKKYDEVTLRLPGVTVEASQSDAVTMSMPIGNYHNFEVKPTCGLASDTKFIGMLDNPKSFYEPEHMFAQLLWFKQGFVEYNFPNNVPYGAKSTELEFSAEMCSEAPQYNLDWPSDITLWINNVEVGTWTSPADFGGERGHLTPAWWPEDQTMYGLLKIYRITEDGSYIDGARLSDVKYSDLNIDGNNHIKVRLGVKPDAKNVGGINLFGDKCGNYPQDLVMRIKYFFPEGEKNYDLK